MDDANIYRFGADHSFSGTHDAERLLAEAKPRRECVVWREGEEHQGFTFGSTGIQTVICDDPQALGSAIARFVEEGGGMPPRRRPVCLSDGRGDADLRISLHADSPSVLALSSSSLQQLAAHGIKLSVICYPFPGL